MFFVFGNDDASCIKRICGDVSSMFDFGELFFFSDLHIIMNSSGSLWDSMYTAYTNRSANFRSTPCARDHRIVF